MSDACGGHDGARSVLYGGHRHGRVHRQSVGQTVGQRPFVRAVSAVRRHVDHLVSGPAVTTAAAGRQFLQRQYGGQHQCQHAGH